MLGRLLLPLVALLAGGCTPDPTAAHPPTAREPLELRAPGEVVLDTAPGGDALVGRVLPPPEESDADRVLTVRWLTRTGARAWRYAGAQVLEARFVPSSGAVLVLTPERALVRLDRPDAQGVTIDRDVTGPLSLDAAGRRVVYTRGEMGELEVVRAEIASGATTALAPGFAPAWCPVLSPDGATVLVVASPEGTPGFYHLRDGRAPERWIVPDDTPLPTGPTAPVWSDGRLVYESDGALYALDPQTAARARMPGLGLPVLVRGATGAASTVLAHDPLRHTTALSPRELAGVAR